MRQWLVRWAAVAVMTLLTLLAPTALPAAQQPRPTATATAEATAEATEDATALATDAATADATADATAETSVEATAAAPTNPLAGRLGGSRASFERVYGQPASDTLGAVLPFGVEYRPDGYDTVGVFFHKRLVLAVRLSADLAPARGEIGAAGPWSVAEARRIADQLFPADTVLGDEPIDAGADRLVSRGHSRALESTFGRATYQRYGAVGDRGDVHAVLILDAAGRVVAIEVRLGTAEGFTADERRYVAEVEERARLLNASVRRVGVLYTAPRADAAWENAVRAELVYWRLADDALRGIVPPPAFTDVHARYREGFVLYRAAADDLGAALDLPDADRLDRAAEKLRAAADRLDGAARALTDLRTARGTG